MNDRSTWARRFGGRVRFKALQSAAAIVLIGCLGDSEPGPIPAEPPREWCDGIDNDRDGLVDEIDCPVDYGCDRYGVMGCRCAATHMPCESLCLRRTPDLLTATCNGVCTRVGYDISNCGACGRRCALGESCSAGTCYCISMMCNGVCTPNSHDNCGACGRRCRDDEICDFGRCTCPDRWRPCGPDFTCISVDGDDQNCGACGRRCEAGTHCRFMACVR